MHPTTYQRERRRLAERLREIREQAGISGSQLARRHGWVQPRVSRIETGKQLPTEDDIRDWADLIDADERTRAELRDMLGRAHAEYANWREAYAAAGGAAAAQTDIATRESETTHIRKFVPVMVPALLQTTAYARELLSLPTGPAAHGATDDEIAEMLAERMRRQQILYEPGRRIEIVVMEAALRTRLARPETLAGQLDRLAAAASSGLASFELGIIPEEEPLPVYPLSGFTVYDEGLVAVETIVGEHQVSKAEDVATYTKFFELLRGSAVTGRDAVAIIQRALAALESRHADSNGEPPGTSQ